MLNEVNLSLPSIGNLWQTPIPPPFSPFPPFIQRYKFLVVILDQAKVELLHKAIIYRFIVDLFQIWPIGLIWSLCQITLKLYLSICNLFIGMFCTSERYTRMGFNFVVSLEWYHWLSWSSSVVARCAAKIITEITFYI